MSLKKLSINETECVAAGEGFLNSVKYATLGVGSLFLCSCTGLILDKATNSNVIGAVAGHLANQFIPKLFGEGTADLFIKAYNYFIEENAESAAEEMVDDGVSLTF